MRAMLLKRKARDQERIVRDNTLLTLFDSTFFVLGKSVAKPQGFTQETHFVCWSLNGGDVIARGSAPYELPGTHAILVDGGFLLTIPFRNGANSLLEVRDVRENFALCATLQSDDLVTHPSPINYKESGEQRLHKWGRRVLLIDILNEEKSVAMLIQVEVETRNGERRHVALITLKRLDLKDVLCNYLAPIFSSDQNGAYLTVAVQTRGSSARDDDGGGDDNNSPTSCALLVAINFAKGLLESFYPHQRTTLVKEDYMDENALYKLIFSTVTTENTFAIDAEGGGKTNESAGGISEVAEVILLIVDPPTLIKIGEEVKNKGITLSDGSTPSFTQEQEILIETTVRKGHLYVMHECREASRSLTCYGVEKFDTLWRVQLDSIPQLDLKQRQLLSTGFGFVWLTQRDRIVLFSPVSGHLLGSIALHPTERVLPTLRAKTHPNKSPFAFNQIGVLDVAAMNEGPSAPAVIVVHDVEKLAPAVFDLLSIRLVRME